MIHNYYINRVLYVDYYYGDNDIKTKSKVIDQENFYDSESDNKCYFWTIYHWNKWLIDDPSEIVKIIKNMNISIDQINSIHFSQEKIEKSW